MATEAAWLNGSRLTEKKKAKYALTSTGLLMEGVGKSSDIPLQELTEERESVPGEPGEQRPMQEEVSLEGRFAITQAHKESSQEHCPDNISGANSVGIPDALVMETPLPADRKPD